MRKRNKVLLEISIDTERLTSAAQRAITEVVLKIACSALDADGGTLQILDQSSNALCNVAAAGETRHQILGKIVMVGERISGRAAQTREPILIVGDIHNDRRFAQLLKYEDITSGMSLPIIHANKLIGILNLKRTTSKEPFVEEDLSKGADIAKSVASALSLLSSL